MSASGGRDGIVLCDTKTAGIIIMYLVISVGGVMQISDPLGAEVGALNSVLVSQVCVASKACSVFMSVTFINASLILSVVAARV